MIATTLPAQIRAELDELHALYEDGSSPTVEAYLVRYGELLPQRVAEMVCTEHGLSLAEIETDVYWSGKSVYTVSLFSTIGY